MCRNFQTNNPEKVKIIDLSSGLVLAERNFKRARYTYQQDMLRAVYNLVNTSPPAVMEPSFSGDEFYIIAYNASGDYYAYIDCAAALTLAKLNPNSTLETFFYTMYTFLLGQTDVEWRLNHDSDGDPLSIDALLATVPLNSRVVYTTVQASGTWVYGYSGTYYNYGPSITGPKHCAVSVRLAHRLQLMNADKYSVSYDNHLTSAERNIRVVRRDSDGRYFIVHSSPAKVYFRIKSAARSTALGSSSMPYMSLIRNSLTTGVGLRVAIGITIVVEGSSGRHLATFSDIVAVSEDSFLSAIRGKLASGFRAVLSPEVHCFNVEVAGLPYLSDVYTAENLSRNNLMLTNVLATAPLTVHVPSKDNRFYRLLDEVSTDCLTVTVNDSLNWSIKPKFYVGFTQLTLHFRQSWNSFSR